MILADGYPPTGEMLNEADRRIAAERGRPWPAVDTAATRANGQGMSVCLVCSAAWRGPDLRADSVRHTRETAHPTSSPDEPAGVIRSGDYQP